MREVAAECERPVLLFSGGKDSAVLLRLAEKAFRPGRFPFPIMHVDTGHNFPEVLDFRDKRMAELGENLLVASVQESIDAGRWPTPVPDGSRNRLQSVTLLDAIAQHQASTPASAGPVATRTRPGPKSACCRFATPSGSGTPATSALSCGTSTRARSAPGEHLRAFPLSDWTELDVWQYIRREDIELPSIYYAHRRPVVEPRRHAPGRVGLVVAPTR